MTGQQGIKAVFADSAAVVGMGCRFPGGASGVEAFWDLLASGGSGVVEVPADRWDLAAFHDPDPDVPGRMYSKFGGFVDGIREFDPAVFGIPAEEAAEIDPQQRMVLEVAWEALEHAGIAPDSLRGSRTGVFVGLSGSDFDRLYIGAGDATAFGGYTATGSALNMAANRLSYVLGLEGPSLVVDTACSSSLVAVHLACQSLRAGECETAIVAGVNALLSPGTTVALSKGRMLSSEGRCKTFDASADGYSRGEGCGVVVLRRLSAADEEGRRIWAVVRGSAVNQDGRSNGLTAPRGGAQEDVIRWALEAGKVRPADVGYVEAHGTGTALGDPIEVRALAAVLAEGRDSSRPVALGSVKTNIGHLEAAAGIAGLIKTILIVERGKIPPHPHLERLNPFIAWDDLPVTVPTALTEWAGERRVAGVSSFGFGGTNAHVVLESVPAPEPSDEPGDVGPVLVKVAGRGEGAVRAGAARLAAWLRDHPEAGIGEVAWAANVGRAELPDRAAVVAGTTGELVEGLDAVAAGRPAPAVVHGRSGLAGRPRVGFVIPGQGPRLAGALAGVYGRVPAVTEVVDAVAGVFGPITELPLRALLEDGEQAAEALQDTAIAQPVLFTVAVALGHWWRSIGVEPDMVLGHSAGAYAAAVLSGVWSLADGARLASARAKLMGDLPPVGAMAAVFCAPDRLAELDQFRRGDVVIASYNGPQETVISGPTESVLAVLDTMEKRAVRGTRLRVSYASHGPMMAPVLGPLGDAFSGVTPRPPQIELISDSTGEMAGPEVTTADYWVRHTRHPVLFSKAMRTMLDRGAGVVVELGPGGLLPLFMAAAADREPVCVPSVVTETSVAQGLLESAARVWAAGVEVDWTRVNGRRPDRVPMLPTYPFQRLTLWPAMSGPAAPAVPAPAITPPAPRPEPPEPRAERPAAATATTGKERITQLTVYLRQRLAEVLELPDARDLNDEIGLFDLGLTSAMVGRLRVRFERDLGRTVPTTAVFEHPTIRRLARYLNDLDALPVAPGERPDVRPDAGAAEGPEAVAIVGMACRFPGGADDLDAYWRLLREGRDATGPLPPERWDAKEFSVPGKQHAFRGGFLDVPVDAFDAEAFGIAPREARVMDPQQRLLLEVAWEALEDAGHPATEADDVATGVFVGMTTTDYLQLLSAGDAAYTTPYVASGNSFSVAAGRLSYYLNATGPSMAIDTACSSSMVAVHLAVRSLRSGESDRAIVAGVNLMLSPTTTASLVSLGALSPGGRCKTFDASADGYARGEGAGALVLKRLSDALADGDRVWAVVRGTAVNQDGRSAGLTVPNGSAQQAVIRDALRDADVDPDAVSYVEAHGTGTALGDPVEVDALMNVLRPRDRGATPLRVGSVKTNLGHLEAAAGVSSLIKTVLSLRHREIPPHLHFADPNPHIAWSDLPIEIPVELTQWESEGPRIAGVSSFGFSGTNAHAVLEEAPPAPAPEPEGTEPRAELLLLSAHTDAALKAVAEAYDGLLTAPGEAGRWPDITRAAALRRTHLPVRMAVTARSAAEAAEGLTAAARGERPAAIRSGRALAADQRRLIFVYSGQGSQWAGMARGLLEDPVCADVLRRCDERVRELAGWSLLDELVADRAASRLADTMIAQPAIVAVQMALTELWRAWGVAPDAIVGHSVGEISAAYAAGALDLDRAMGVVVRRGEVMAATRGSGAMVAIALPPEEVEELIAPHGDRLSIAAVNGPAATVIAGDPETLAGLEPGVRQRRVRWAKIQDEYAFHTPRMEAVRADLAAALPSLSPAATTVPVFSTVTGQRAEPGAFDAAYWGENMVRPVRFRDAVRAAATPDAHAVLLEVGPNAGLVGPASQSLDGQVPGVTALASMRARKDARTTLLNAAGGLHVLGHDLDHRAIQPAAGRHVSLPSYPWQRQSYWIPGGRAVPSGGRAAEAEEDLSRHIYEVEWRPSDPPRMPASDAARAGTWVLLADESGFAEQVAGQLEAAGRRTVTLQAAVTRDELRTVLSGLDPVDGLIHCGALGTHQNVDAALAASCGPLLAVTQALDAGPGSPTPKLWVVTRGGAAVGDGPVTPLHAPVWGAGRVIALEEPTLWGGLIDLDPSANDTGAAAVAAEVLAPDGEDQIAYRAGERRVARLRAGRERLDGAATVSIRDDAAYLITGGRGALGLRVAAWLADRGVRHLVLTGRGPLPDDNGHPAVAAIRRLRERGVEVHTPDADVADEAAMARIFHRADGTPWPRIRGVVHAAGTFEARAVRDMSLDQFRAVLRPKVEGTLVLDALTREADLDFFVMFSSASAIWGSASAGHYAAANCFEDLMAHDRAQRGLPGLAVNWGWWSDSDLVAAEHLDYFASMGLDVLPDRLGLALLDRLLASKVRQLTVAPVDWSRFRPVMEAKRRRPLLELMGEDSAAVVPVDEALLKRLREASGAARVRLLESRVQREVAAVLGLPADAPPLDPELGFFDAGMDSIMSVEVRDRMQAILGVELPPTVTFEQPTVAALTAYLLAEALVLPAADPDPEADDGGGRYPVDDLAERLDDLSEEELVELLTEELEQK